MGAVFGKVATSLVNDVVMPPIGPLLKGVDFSSLYLNISGTVYPSLAGAKAPAPVSGECCVLRIGRDAEAAERLRREAELLRTLAGRVPVPQVFTAGKCRGVPYQVQEFVQGDALHRAWKGLPAEDRDAIVAELASYLRVLHGMAFATFGGYGRHDQHPPWEAFWEGEWRALLAAAPATLPAPLADLVRRAEECFERWRQALREGRATLVHGDLWPGNILVRDGHITALLDFESALQAPKDYELLRMEQFGLYPNDYAAEGDEVH